MGSRSCGASTMRANACRREMFAVGAFAESVRFGATASDGRTGLQRRSAAIRLRFGPVAVLGGLMVEAKMLSIGKLALGHADYYLEQARRATTRARAVASGVEDYYVGGSEPAGEWIGGGGALLGLRGEVGRHELHRMLAGEHP